MKQLFIFFLLHLVTVHHWEKSGQKLKVGTWKQMAWKNAAICSRPGPHPVTFLTGPRPTYLGMELPTVGRALLDQVAIKKASHGHTSNLVEAISQWRFLLPRCVKFTTKINHHVRYLVSAMRPVTKKNNIIYPDSHPISFQNHRWEAQGIWETYALFLLRTQQFLLKIVLFLFIFCTCLCSMWVCLSVCVCSVCV